MMGVLMVLWIFADHTWYIASIGIAIENLIHICTSLCFIKGYIMLLQIDGLALVCHNLSCNHGISIASTL